MSWTAYDICQVSGVERNEQKPVGPAPGTAIRPFFMGHVIASVAKPLLLERVDGFVGKALPLRNRRALFLRSARNLLAATWLRKKKTTNKKGGP